MTTPATAFSQATGAWRPSRLPRKSEAKPSAAKSSKVPRLSRKNS